MKTDLLTIAFQRIRSRFVRRDYPVDDDCEDALQEAFCRLWRRHVEIDDISHAEGLLSITSKNIMIDGLRKRSIHQQVNLGEIGDPPWEHNENDSDELYAEVARMAAEKLTDRDREILFLREKDGMEFSELAVKFGISEANTRLIVSRARKTLREMYKKRL